MVIGGGRRARRRVAALGAVAAPRRRRDRPLAALALAEAAEAIAGALRTGVGRVDAVLLASAGAPLPLRAELANAAGSAGRGVPFVAAVEAWAVSSCAPGAALVAAAIVLAAETGGDVPIALDRAALTLRERVALDREVGALASQARSSAVVLAAAPVAFAVVAALIDPRTAGFLLRSPIGIGCLAAGLGLNVAGWRWMARITRSVSS